MRTGHINFPNHISQEMTPEWETEAVQALTPLEQGQHQEFPNTMCNKRTEQSQQQQTLE